MYTVTLQLQHRLVSEMDFCRSEMKQQNMNNVPLVGINIIRNIGDIIRTVCKVVSGAFSPVSRHFHVLSSQVYHSFHIITVKNPRLERKKARSIWNYSQGRLIHLLLTNILLIT